MYKPVLLMNIIYTIASFILVYLFAYTISPKYSAIYITPIIFATYILPLIITIKILDNIKEKRNVMSLSVIAFIFMLFMIIRCIQRLSFYTTGYYMLEKAPGFILLILISAMFKLDVRNNGLCIGRLTSYRKSICIACYVMPIIPLIVMLLENINQLYISLNVAILSTGYYIVNSFFEEYLFRGLIFTWLSNTLLGTIWGGIVVQGILFGLWHLPHHIVASNINIALIHMLLATGIGILFGLIRAITGSIIVPIVLHTLWNTLITMVTATLKLDVIQISLFTSSYILSISLCWIIYKRIRVH